MFNISRIARMESINKLIELSATYREMADKFIEINKELVFRNSNIEKRVKGLITENKKLTRDLEYLIREMDYQYQEEIRHAQDLEDSLRLNAEMDLFVAILAHDLRNPFNALLNLSEFISENIRQMPIEEIQFQTEMINKSAHSANDLLNDILVWVTNQSKATPFNPLKVSLSDICRKALEVLYPMAEAKHIGVDCALGNDVIADPDMLHAIFRNLITNAIKYTPQHGKINITSEHRNEDVMITVADSGIGIDPKRLNTLFDFSKMQSTSGTEHEKGTGLGLIICKQFVERHGGKLWAESLSGKGSRFSFTIPLKIVEPVEIHETATTS